jgi:leader peptidase (prepilin peptidase) / N-methyltransferase
LSTAAEAGRVRKPFPARGLAAAVAVLLIGACFVEFGATPRAFIAAFFVSALVAVCATDLERRIIPNRIVLPATAVVFAAQTALAPERAFEWVFAGIAAASILALPLLIAPGGMGMGDVKLALLLGAMLGRYVWVALVVAFLAAFVAAFVILLRHGAEGRQRSFAFGPFLAVGAIVALLAGERVAALYAVS